MKVFTSADKIRNALKELQPSHVAVAYVGANWKRYINADQLKEIIVSPRLGSNPRAIEELMKVIGHENVHLLDNLHSKIYLGAGAVMLGSCNLSDNGLSGHGLFEVVTLSESEDVMTQLLSQWESYKKLAQFLYPTRKAKLDRLRRLKDETARAREFGLADGPGPKSPSINDYKSGSHRIHVIWYGSEGDEYDVEQIRDNLGESSSFDPEEFFKTAFQFHKDDKIRPGDWLLSWRCKDDDGLPRKNAGISWMPVHYVIPNGFASDEYPLLAGEVAAGFPTRVEPFRLDATTKALIRELLVSGKFPALLSRDESTWHLTPADAVTPAFIDALRKASRTGIKRK